MLGHFVRISVVYVIGLVSMIHIAFRSRPYFRKEGDIDEVDRRWRDMADLDGDGEIVVVGEAERLNNDSYETISGRLRQDGRL